MTVISPELTAKLSAWAEQGRILCVARQYRSGDAVGYLLVLCATDCAAVNEQAAREARDLQQRRAHAGFRRSRASSPATPFGTA